MAFSFPIRFQRFFFITKQVALRNLRVEMMLLLTESYAVSIDCSNLVTFAQTLGIQTKQPTIWSQLQTDCCGGITATTGVTCVSQRVTEIKWEFKNLNGFIDGTKIPPLVTYLHLGGNLITGTIPSTLPNVLSTLYLSNNQLSGSIPILPNTVINFSVSGNDLTGDLPNFPPNLQFLTLGYPESIGNHLTGTLRLNAPTYLFINDNWITDVIITHTTGLSTAECDLSNNPLLGNPNIPVGGICKQTGLYSANSLPKTITTIKPTTAKSTTTTVKSTIAKTAVTTTVKSTTAMSSTTATSITPISTLSFSMTTTYDVLRMTKISATSIPISTSLWLNSPNSLNVTNQNEIRWNSTDLSTEYSTEVLLNTNTVTDVIEKIIIPTAAVVDPILIYAVLAGLVGLCVLVVISGLVIKNPKMHSKFGRKNSFGTLNTVATGKS